jgi:hypothetical protein
MCGQECITPHREERSRSDDQAARETLRDSCRDVGLAHSYVIAEQGAVELIERSAQARDRGNLVRFQ